MKMGIFGVILVIYMIGLLPGILIGFAGEDVFDYGIVGGIFLWPLVLCALLLYGIYILIKAVVRKFRNARRN
jgi:uncharacterized membrane protein